MTWKKCFPWRWIIRKAALKEGFLDPVDFLSKLQRFAQPSEVAAPVELIRLATVLQARGLLNVQAIQHNLDWIWPYWVERQFDPRDPSFVPRAFSLTHINLTHRNWTAVGVPDFPHYPIVDPRGLLTPFYDSWSIDAWILYPAGEDDLIPSKAATVFQHWETEGNPCVRTEVLQEGSLLTTRLSAQSSETGKRCVLQVDGFSGRPARLVISVRPFNPEGVSEIGSIASLKDATGWAVNQKRRIYFSDCPEVQYFSNYREGDVYLKLKKILGKKELRSDINKIECSAGMATAAAVFPITPGRTRRVEVCIPLEENSGVPSGPDTAVDLWKSSLEGHSRLHTADRKTNELYENSIRALVLHTPNGDAFPGPYTYKHFWFRDACFILHSLLSVNLRARAEKILDTFPGRQRNGGYFCSQAGEWDSNGQVLWVFRRYCELTQSMPKEAWKKSIQAGADWIIQKRTSEKNGKIHAGLFPAGFSAEHLGPNDYYYWDDFWGVEGLFSAAFLMNLYGDSDTAVRYQSEAAHFLNSIEKSLNAVSQRLDSLAMPSSPHRRLDSGAVGSLAAGYPLGLWAPNDPRVLETVEYLLKNHFINGGFYHEMSHSGINPYLTLSIAQVLLRNEDPRFADLLRAIQGMASSTGQWPEAVHPQGLGGCMGDGQHMWASAEWIMMIRNCFAREENNRLILCSGVLPEWFDENEEAGMEDIPTPYGSVSVKLQKEEGRLRVVWHGKWNGDPPRIEVRLPEIAEGMKR